MPTGARVQVPDGPPAEVSALRLWKADGLALSPTWDALGGCSVSKPWLLSAYVEKVYRCQWSPCRATRASAERNWRRPWSIGEGLGPLRLGP